MKTKDLTDAKLNRMVAECEGWSSIENHPTGLWGWRKIPEGQEQPPTAKGDMGFYSIPDYCISHDAILPCVRGLTEAQQFDFTSLLCGLVSKEGGLFQLITAPARTLVLAYLRAKEKL